jgi:hypothetical protein
MKARTAKKILKRWSREFRASMGPREAHEAGTMPWSWGTWQKAHRVWGRYAYRFHKRGRSTSAQSDE